jgi:CheY-like chemotaxis protein
VSTAYGIILRHGGKIEVESEVGKGSTFTLQFPAITKKASLITRTETEQETIAEQETNEKNLRVLVVDDNKDICNILDKFLSRTGHKVITVDNGADAIELIKKETFGLVLCDLAMPNVFGYDVIKVLNGLKKRPKTGIITGWGEKLTPIEEGMNVDFIIKKPFNLSELSQKINDSNLA